MPPATMTIRGSARIRSCASMAEKRPDPQTLPMVAQGVADSRPALRAAWRAGAWPSPAGSTQPISTSSISSAGRAVSCRQARIAAAPKVVAETGDKAPSMAPMGVRRAAAMTVCLCLINESVGNSFLTRSAICYFDSLEKGSWGKHGSFRFQDVYWIQADAVGIRLGVVCRFRNRGRARQ